jgi:hypothetical protein
LIADYDDPDGEPHFLQARVINPYLVDAPIALLRNRTSPISNAPAMNYGSFALDDGNYTLDASARKEILEASPEAAKYLHPFIGGQELLHSEQRWCLWLKNASPSDIRTQTAVAERVERVRKWRLESNRETTRKLAATPTLFAEIRQPTTKYIAIPTVSSERRTYIPLAFLGPEVIASNQIYVLAGAALSQFGVLTSAMHMAWVRFVCGRMKSDFRYSAGIVYNNFPWPELPLEPLSHRERGRGEGAGEASSSAPAEPSSVAARHLLTRKGTPQGSPQGEGSKRRAAIETAAQAVLDARAQFPDSTLADLYDPLSMPPALVKAHQALDRAVDAAYIAAEKAAGRKPPKLGSDAERVAFLFERYQQLTSLLPVAKAKPARRK